MPTNTAVPGVCPTCGAALSAVAGADPIMLAQDVEAYLRRPESTLRHWRVQGVGPKWFKLGRRVAYRRSDVDAWLAEQLNTPAS